jgi:hypothetical protein
MATLRQQEDGGYTFYILLFANKKQQQVQSTTVLLKILGYIYNKLSICIQQQKYSHVIDVFYIFNSTVVD